MSLTFDRSISLLKGNDMKSVSSDKDYVVIHVLKFGFFVAFFEFCLDFLQSALVSE